MARPRSVVFSVDDEQKPGEAKEKAPRRMRLIRNVRTPPPPPDGLGPAEPPEDEADPGTPEMDASLRRGCTGCLNVTGLIFVIMLLSIIGTCYLRDRQIP